MDMDKTELSLAHCPSSSSSISLPRSLAVEEVSSTWSPPSLFAFALRNKIIIYNHIGPRGVVKKTRVMPGFMSQLVRRVSAES